MRNPLRYLKNAVRVALLKIRYRGKIDIGIIQTFEKLRIDIAHKGTIEIGSYNQNRDKLYIGVDGGRLKIGNHCFFNINSSITCVESIEIGNNCKFGNNLVIIDHDHNFKTQSPEFVSSPIKIGYNVWCGANVTILRGTDIGDNCVIGAGATVKGKIEADSLMVPKNVKDVCIIERKL
jgi:acetyltransferase-like isoleucine patch superfamily enzyme